MFYPGLAHNTVPSLLAADARKAGPSTSFQALLETEDQLLYHLLTSFQIDMPFMFEHAPALLCPRDGGLIIVHSLEDMIKVRSVIKNCGAIPSISVWAPKMPEYGSQHAKLIVAVYASRIRVIITSQNLVPADLDFKAGTFFWQDFPKRASSAGAGAGAEAGSSSSSSSAAAAGGAGSASAAASAASAAAASDDPRRDFGASLLFFLGQMNKRLGEGSKLGRVIAEVEACDFSAAHAVLVPTVPWESHGSRLFLGGHLRIRKAMMAEIGGNAAAHSQPAAGLGAAAGRAHRKDDDDDDGAGAGAGAASSSSLSRASACASGHSTGTGAAQPLWEWQWLSPSLWERRTGQLRDPSFALQCSSIGSMKEGYFDGQLWASFTGQALTVSPPPSKAAGAAASDGGGWGTGISGVSSSSSGSAGAGAGAAAAGGSSGIGHKRPHTTAFGSSYVLSSTAATQVTAYGGERPPSFAVAVPAKAAPDKVHLVLPSFDMVCHSLEGWIGGDSVPIPYKHLVSRLRPFLAEYDASVAGRQRCVPHIKTAELYAMAPLPAAAALPPSRSRTTGSSSSSSAGGTGSVPAQASSHSSGAAPASAAAGGDSQVTYDAFADEEAGEGEGVICLLSDSGSDADADAKGGSRAGAGAAGAARGGSTGAAGSAEGAGAGRAPSSAIAAAQPLAEREVEVDAGFLSGCDEDDTDEAGHSGGAGAGAGRSSKSRHTTAASAKSGTSAGAAGGAGSSSSSLSAAAAASSSSLTSAGASAGSASAAATGSSIPVLQCFYTGSHNLSVPAWGELQAGMVGGTQLFCRSFELGVLALPSFVSQGPHDPVLLAPDWALLALPADVRAALTSPGACPRLVGVPLPYALPPRRYGFTPSLADRPYDKTEHGHAISHALDMGNQAALAAAINAAATDPFEPPPTAAAARGKGGRGGGGAGAGSRGR